MIRRQRELVHRRIGDLPKSEIREGLSVFKSGLKQVAIVDIPGIVETGARATALVAPPDYNRLHSGGPGVDSDTHRAAS